MDSLERSFVDIPGLHSIFEAVAQAAATDANVLVLGESGTGKELIAEALHELSPRKGRPFVKVSCAALGEKLLDERWFELAAFGTLFLDEIGAIPSTAQEKLLRALQARELERAASKEPVRGDVRVVSATNRDLAAEVKTGRFRGDLYSRLNVVAVTLPPLRNRKADIPELAVHFVARFAKRYGKQIDGLDPGALGALLGYDWPGNVRELENAIERAVVLGRGAALTTNDLPAALRGPHAVAEGLRSLVPGATLRDIEREAILQTLEMVGGSTLRAAKVLGISVRKLQYRLKEYGTRRRASEPDPVDGG
jgi:two-component system NtrC family response regulator/two-component system response regulator HydG